MEQNILNKLIEEGLSLRQISDKLSVSQDCVRYWLKKFGLKTRRGPKGKLPKDMATIRKCSCGETDPKKFYGHKKSICGKCQNAYNNKKAKETRQKAVEFLGGKCMHCGFNKFICSLDIHHIDPNVKDQSFKTMRYWSWKRLESELKKCTVLCKNCHAAFHNGQIKNIGL